MIVPAEMPCKCRMSGLGRVPNCYQDLLSRVFGCTWNIATIIWESELESSEIAIPMPMPIGLRRTGMRIEFPFEDEPFWVIFSQGGLSTKMQYNFLQQILVEI